MAIIPYGIDIKISAESIAKLKETDAKASKRIRNGLNKIARGDTSKKLVTALGIGNEPDAPGYPWGQFPWRSRKQKIAVLIKLKRKSGKKGKWDRGGWQYQRTHKLSRGWAVAVTSFNDTGAILRVYNEVPYTIFVQGKWAQRFHKNRWPQAKSIMTSDAVRKGYKDEITNTWAIILRNQEP